LLALSGVGVTGGAPLAPEAGAMTSAQVISLT
jgi:hypothetical protein